MDVDTGRSAELFRLLVESVEDYAIFVLDPQGSVATWNPGAERIKGYRESEIVGRHFSTFYGEADRARGVPDHNLDVARRTGRWQGEGWRVRKDGSRFWAAVTITALRDPGGGIVGFAKVTRDLTERREAEEELRSRQARLVQAQQIARLGSWEWELDADVLRWSDELYAIYGIEPAEFDGTLEGYLARVHPEDRDRVRDTLDRSRRTAQPFEFEERIVRPDGELRVLRSRGEVRPGTEDLPARMIGVALDVTLLKEAEQHAIQLAREHAARNEAENAARRMAFLAEASRVLGHSIEYEATLRQVARLAVPDYADWCAIDLFDVDGSIRRVAGAGPGPGGDVDASGQDRADSRDPDPDGALGSVRATGETIFLPGDPAATPDRDASALDGIRGPHGDRFSSAIIAPLPGRERTLGALTLVHAGSGRHHTDRDRLLAEDLARRAGAAIENADLVHELRQARDILEEQAAELESQTEELQSTLSELENTAERLEESNRALRTASEEAERARVAAEEANATKSRFLATMSHELRTPLNAIAGYAQLIEVGVHGPVNADQLQAIRRIQRNQRHLLGLINDLLHMSKIEAGQLRLDLQDIPVADVLGDLDPLIAPLIEGHELTFDCRPPDGDLRVHADRERLDQILLNLLSNAIKFSQPGGRILVHAERQDDTVLIHVADTTGGGIAPDRIESVFEPFFQAHTGRDAEGVGLGLAISRDLARAMGGDLTVHSEVGVGSTFTLTLPT